MSDLEEPVASLREVAGGIDVWLIRTETVPRHVLDRCRSGLTTDELMACDRLRHEADRRSAMICRTLVRASLSRYARVAPAAWVFSTGDHGRPEIARPYGTGLRFNVSHTRHIVACAITLDSDVGVDVEQVPSIGEAEPIADSICAAGERLTKEEVREVPPEELARRVATLWTLKEAYLKARGVGFSLSPRHVTFDLSVAAKVSVSFSREVADDPARWWFCTLEVGDAHLLSVAMGCSGTPSHVSILETGPSRLAELRSRRHYVCVSRPAADATITRLGDVGQVLGT
jgi:4'-phosphopantetheinyl transferase